MTRTIWITVVAAALAAATAGCKGGPKLTEAEGNLQRMAAQLEAKFAKGGTFPQGRVGPTPPISCCMTADKLCGGDPTAWQLPLWTEIGFAVPGKHHFVYSYEGTATNYTATATADLDCDGESVTFTLTGTGQGKKVTTTWSKPEKLD